MDQNSVNSLRNCLTTNDTVRQPNALSSRACAFSIAALVGDTEEEEEEEEEEDDEDEDEETGPIISPLGKRCMLSGKRFVHAFSPFFPLHLLTAAKRGRN